MRIVEIPFAYSADLVFPGRRKTQSRSVLGSVLVEVAELSEAPVAVRLGRDQWLWHGGKLWQSCGVGADRLSDPDWLGRSGPFLPMKHGIVPEATAGLEKPLQTGASRMEGSDLAAAEAAARRRAEDVMVIGGVVHRASLGPLHAVVPSERKDKSEIATISLPDPRPRLAPALVFRADKLEAAREFARAHWRRVDDFSQDAEILIPEAVHAVDDASFAAVNGVSEALEAIREQRIRNFPDEALLALADAMEARESEEFRSAAARLAAELAPNGPHWLCSRKFAAAARSGVPEPAPRL